MNFSQAQASPHIICGNVNAMRPTQMSVGEREVNYRRKLWADFLRVRIAEELALSDFDQALQNALAFAHQQEAHYLPGWSGEMNR